MNRPIPFAVGLIMVASNLLTSSMLGLGDGESLYYCYGANPSLSYLDHPPLIGWLIWLTTSLGGANVMAVRAVPIVMTLASLFFMCSLARDLDDSPGDKKGLNAVDWCALLLLATPVFSVGMTAATPDTSLVALWSLFTWQLNRALKDNGTGQWSRLGRPLLLGVVLGLSFLSKYTGALLIVTVFIAIFWCDNKPWLKMPGFWIATLAAAAIASPVFIWNAQNDWAGLMHRLVWTQSTAGFSFTNLGKLVGGQLLYVGPLMLPLLIWSAVNIWKNRTKYTEKKILLAASIPTLVITYLLVLWSSVAEPHWPAIGYVPMFVAASLFASKQTKKRPKIFIKATIGFGIFVYGIAHLVVLTPVLPLLTPKQSYEPKYDLGNELIGWPQAAQAIREINEDKKPVVAAFYTQCAQLTFALNQPDDPEVRCVSKEKTDFHIWKGNFNLSKKGALFVTDNRFDHDPKILFKHATVEGPKTVEITRSGIPARTFYIWELAKPDHTSQTGGVFSIRHRQPGLR